MRFFLLERRSCSISPLLVMMVGTTRTFCRLGDEALPWVFIHICIVQNSAVGAERVDEWINLREQIKVRQDVGSTCSPAPVRHPTRHFELRRGACIHGSKRGTS